MSSVGLAPTAVFVFAVDVSVSSNKAVLSTLILSLTSNLLVAPSRFTVGVSAVLCRSHPVTLLSFIRHISVAIPSIILLNIFRLQEMKHKDKQAIY